jgi:hypothetical protein
MRRLCLLRQLQGLQNVQKRKKKCRSLRTKKNVDLFVQGTKKGSKVCKICKIKRSTKYHAMYPEYDTNYIYKRCRIYRALYIQ